MGDNFLRRDGKFRCCVLFVKAIPLFLVASLICYSYYAYVYVLCIQTIKSPAESTFNLMLYHFILVLFLWSYIRTVATVPGKIPQSFRITEAMEESFRNAQDEDSKLKEIDTIGARLPLSTRVFINGKKSYRICAICKHVKPDRCHHCQVCGKCVLKMDHHCPWVNNCVSFTNYKYFTLFLFYTLVYSVFLAITSLEYFRRTWKSPHPDNANIHIIFLFILASMFTLSMLSIFCYHVYLCSYNRTTLESFRGPIMENGKVDKSAFNLGLLKNFQQVFGNNYWLWPVPIYTSLGNGVNFPQRRDIPDRMSLLSSDYFALLADEEEEDVFVNYRNSADVFGV